MAHEIHPSPAPLHRNPAENGADTAPDTTRPRHGAEPEADNFPVAASYINSAFANGNAAVPPPLSDWSEPAPTSISEQDYRDDVSLNNANGPNDPPPAPPSAPLLSPEHPNRDPLTGEPGAHPVGVGIGALAAGAALTTAAYGTVGALAGPLGAALGAAVGAAVGAVAGAYAGKNVSESVNPSLEDAYWRDNYTSRPYAADTDYDVFRPAYEYGWNTFRQHTHHTFDDAEPELRQGWETTEHSPLLSWERAKHAVRDAWDRLRRHPGA